MLYSFVKNNPNYDGDYIIMHDEKLTTANIDSIKTLYKHLKFYKITNEFSIYNKFIDQRCHRFFDWTQSDYSVFSRFEIFNFEEYDKIIYLDSDIIVNKSIDYLIQECNDSECYAATQDNPYGFNAGVLVINKKTTFTDYKIRCVNMLSSGKSLTGNQPVFIECFKNTVSYLPAQYNLTVLCRSAKELLDTNRVNILHFPGKEKPWSDKIKFSDCYMKADGKIRDKFLQIWNGYADLYQTYILKQI